MTASRGRHFLPTFKVARVSASTLVSRAAALTYSVLVHTSANATEFERIETNHRFPLPLSLSQYPSSLDLKLQ